MQLMANLLTTGVALFFALSGFLLYRPWAEAALSGSPSPSIGRYARRRALRILPAYLVILLLAAFVLGTTTVAQGPDGATLGVLYNPWHLLANLALVQDLFPATAGTGVMPAWSLAVEVCFYISLPLLGLLAVRAARGSDSRGRRRAALAPPLIMLAIGLAGKVGAAVVVPGVYGLPASGWHYVLESSILAHADEFCFGMLVAVLRYEYVNDRLLLPGRRTRILAEAILLSTMLALVVWAPGYRPYMAWTVAALLFAGLLAVVVMPPRRGQRRIVTALEWRPVAWTGMVSYSIFLWNQPVAFWLYAHGIFRPGLAWFPVNLAIDLVVCIGLSWLTFRWVERPAMSRRTSQPPVPLPDPAAS